MTENWSNPMERTILQDRSQPSQTLGRPSVPNRNLPALLCRAHRRSRGDESRLFGNSFHSLPDSGEFSCLCNSAQPCAPGSMPLRRGSTALDSPQLRRISGFEPAIFRVMGSDAGIPGLPRSCQLASNRKCDRKLCRGYRPRPDAAEVPPAGPKISIPESFLPGRASYARMEIGGSSLCRGLPLITFFDRLP
jgi:hypothetical protein